MILFEMLTHEGPAERAGSDEAARPRPSGAHRDLDARHDAVVLRMIAADPAERPGDAFAARRVLTALTWPGVVEPAAPKPAAPKARAPEPRGARLVAVDARSDVATDAWTGRSIERVPLTDRSLARARAFARAAHPGLQLVLRVAREDDDGRGARIWLAAPAGRAPEGLTKAEERAIAAALDALHAVGCAHGAVDAAHVVVDGTGGATLRFGAEHTGSDGMATVDRDRLDLARLARRTGG
jgi:serine/threonine-protein kinase